MSTTSSSATTTLYVNGKPAQDELARLRSEVDKYKKQLLDIAADPSKGLGSSAWDEQVKKIRAVKEELAKVNAETKAQTSLWERFAKNVRLGRSLPSRDDFHHRHYDDCP